MTISNNTSTDDFSLMVHGGAGALSNTNDPEAAATYRDSLTRVLEHGRSILAAGGTVLDAVEACAVVLVVWLPVLLSNTPIGGLRAA